MVVHITSYNYIYTYIQSLIPPLQPQDTPSRLVEYDVNTIEIPWKYQSNTIEIALKYRWMLSFFCVIGSLVILPFGKQGVCSSQAGFHVRLGRSDMIRCKCLGRPTTTPTEAKFVFCRELEAKIPNRTSKSTSARDSETQSNKANTCNKPHTKTIYIYMRVVAMRVRTWFDADTLSSWKGYTSIL